MIDDTLYCLKQSADIEVCEDCKNFQKCDHTLQEEIARYAVKMLEKQVPQKPIEKHYEVDGEKSYIKICCPNGCPVQVSRFDNYCNKCGQKLDWDIDS